MGHKSSVLVAGDEAWDMELEKQSQEPGGEWPTTLISGPSCVWEGTMENGLGSGSEKVASAFSPENSRG